MEALGAKKETGDGFSSWTLDCGPRMQVQHIDLSGDKPASGQAPKRQAVTAHKPGIRVKNRFMRNI